MMNAFKPVIAVPFALGLLSFSWTNSSPAPGPGAGLNYAYGVSLSYGYEELPERAFQLAAQARIGGVRAVLNWSIFEPAPGR